MVFGREYHLRPVGSFLKHRAFNYGAAAVQVQIPGPHIWTVWWWGTEASVRIRDDLDLCKTVLENRNVVRITLAFYYKKFNCSNLVGVALRVLPRIEFLLRSDTESTVFRGTHIEKKNNDYEK